MIIDPNDLIARARRDLARIREAINNETHWVYLTDDPDTAETLRKSASGAIFVETVIHFTDRREAFTLAVLAVSKKAWPPSAAARGAAAAVGKRGKAPDAAAVRNGMDSFMLSEDTHRLALVWQAIREGKLSAEPPT